MAQKNRWVDDEGLAQVMLRLKRRKSAWIFGSSSVTR
jgi:hypothetical protein